MEDGRGMGKRSNKMKINPSSFQSPKKHFGGGFTKRLIFIILICTVFAGCATVTPFSTRDHETIISYQIGQVQQVNTGESMVSEGSLIFYKGLIAESDYKVPNHIGILSPLIPAGTKFEPFGKLSNGDILYKCSDPYIKPTTYLGDPVIGSFCIAVNSPGDAYGDGNCSYDYVNKWSEPSKFLKENKVYTENSFKKELIYNGKEKDIIKISYREYMKDFARPAFYQDLSYDLTESKIISFRKMSIEVIEATNSYIKFIVKSSGI